MKHKQAAKVFILTWELGCVLLTDRRVLGSLFFALRAFNCEGDSFAYFLSCLRLDFTRPQINWDKLLSSTALNYYVKKSGKVKKRAEKDDVMHENISSCDTVSAQLKSDWVLAVSLVGSMKREERGRGQGIHAVSSAVTEKPRPWNPAAPKRVTPMDSDKRTISWAVSSATCFIISANVRFARNSQFIAEPGRNHG